VAVSKLHICLVSQQYGEVKSGIGVYTRNVARKLLQDGHQVTLICPRERAVPDLPGIRLHPVSGARTGSSHIRWVVLSRRFGRAIRQALSGSRFDLIHFTDAREALFSRRTGIPALGNMNDYYFAAAPAFPWAFRRDYVDWLRRWGYYRLVRFLERRALNKLNAVICNSRHTATVLREAYRIPEHRLTVIYKSIDLRGTALGEDRPERGGRDAGAGLQEEKRPEQTGPESGPQRGREVLFIGGNVQRKGLPTLIRAAPGVLERFPGTVFSVVGDNQNLEAMKALCRREGVSDHFTFWGWQSHDQIQEHYQRAAVFVMPSLIEAFGVVFLEAMAAGVPVVGGDTGGTRELIRDGVNGCLVTPRDHRQLTGRIIQLLDDHTLRQRLIAEGRRTVRAFTVEAMLERTYLLYRKQLGGESGSGARILDSGIPDESMQP
jgi:glycosyltransferase involved in cell wall biosynthesis